jgi:uncharacterized heparinase superfamily protein
VGAGLSGGSRLGMSAAGAWVGEKLVGLRLAVSARYRAWRARPMSLALLRMRIAGVPAPGILLVPQDLRTADPVRADEIMAGVNVFAGRIVTAADPFAAEAPTPEWAEALASFGWLRHLRAAGTPEAAEAGRRLLIAYLDRDDGGRLAEENPTIAAERIRCWLAASGLLLAGGDSAFYRRFSRALWRQVRILEARYGGVAPGADRLSVLVALVTAGLCLEGEDALLAWAARRLDAELGRQVLPDGGHVSRDPGVLVPLVLDLLPLRQLFSARNEMPPAAILTAVDRMMPMIRFFQLGDGSMARFNGMGPTTIDQVATALVYDDSRGVASSSATHSGYERLAAGETVAIVETGATPPPVHAASAHAGCLAFELSSGRQLVVMNCGAPAIHRVVWRDEARKTAAHSTVTVADRSSARFARSGPARGMPVAGPRTVTAKRSGLALAASHDGYESRLGVTHARNLRLSDTGDRLHGEDVVEGAVHPYTARFHLHPTVQPIPTESSRSVILRLANGEAWQFSASQPVAIEESVALAMPEGPRRTLQLAIAVASSAATPRIVWQFHRFARVSRSPDAAQDEPELPL